MLRRMFAGALLVLGAYGIAGADSIKIDGTPYEDVVVSESQTTYYVQIPVDGRTISVPKSDVNPDDVVKSSDKATRAALVEEWRNNSALRKKEGAPAPGVKTVPPMGAGPIPKPETPGAVLAPPPGPQPIEAPYLSPKRPGVVDKQVLLDAKGTKRIVLKGDRQKEEGFETRVEQQKAEEVQRAQQQAEEAARAQAQAEAQAYAAQNRQPDQVPSGMDQGAAQQPPPQYQMPVEPPPDEAMSPDSAVIYSDAIEPGSAIDEDYGEP